MMETKEMTFKGLIKKQQRDLLSFRQNLAVQMKRGQPLYIGDLKRRIREALKSIAVIRAAQYKV
jgi:hypothetical protein